LATEGNGDLVAVGLLIEPMPAPYNPEFHHL
jgi:hypothetical protein